MREDRPSRWAPYLERYRNGEWRALVFRDLILADARRLGPDGALTLLDIGCGIGFDNDPAIQRSLAAVAGRFVSVEPDPLVPLEPLFSEAHRCLLESAPLKEDSVDLAFAVMVLEHAADPQVFWDKVHAVLRPGGVFWGFTMNARHWFVVASRLAERLRLKDWYLSRLHGRRGGERYENYPTYYRTNAPAQVRRLTGRFRELTLLDFDRIGQCDYYFPARLRWLGHGLDHAARLAGFPGAILAVRAVK